MTDNQIEQEIQAFLGNTNDQGQTGRLLIRYFERIKKTSQKKALLNLVHSIARYKK